MTSESKFCSQSILPLLWFDTHVWCRNNLVYILDFLITDVIFSLKISNSSFFKKNAKTHRSGRFSQSYEWNWSGYNQFPVPIEPTFAYTYTCQFRSVCICICSLRHMYMYINSDIRLIALYVQIIYAFLL